MQKKIITILLIIFFSLLFGTSTSGNFFSGDINMIDEGQFSAWANHMIHGKYLFKDIYITYGPLSVYPLFWLFQIFGASAFLVRLYLTLGGTLGIIATFLLMQELKLKKWIITALLCVFLLIPAFNLRESVGLWALYFLVRSLRDKSIRTSFLTGVAVALSCLVSADFGLFVSFVSVVHYVVSCTVDLKTKENFKLFFSYLAGFLTILILFVLWAYSGNWLKDYIVGTVDIITSISGINVPNGVNFPTPIGVLSSGNWGGFVRFLVGHEMLLYWSICVYFAAVFYTVVKLVQKRIGAQDYAFALISLFGLLVYTILLTRHGSGHYFYTLPANLMVCGYFLNKLFDIKRKTITIYIFVLFLFLYIARILYLNNPMIRSSLNISSYFSSQFGSIDRVGMLNISPSQTRKIIFYQNFVSKNTTSSDYIFLFDDEPSIYMLVDRVNPTKFDLPFVGNRMEKRIDIIKDLTSKKPKYVFIDNDAWPVDGISNKVRLPEVYNFIKIHYSLMDIRENVEIYKLK